MALNIENEETPARKGARPGLDAILAEVAEVQAFVADLPDRDTRTAEEILGCDDAGLPS
jgi:hypothetical protein